MLAGGDYIATYLGSELKSSRVAEAYRGDITEVVPYTDRGLYISFLTTVVKQPFLHLTLVI